jgi:ABC-type nitrate/sulfonate/bicarbonate transport system substrate-binding protein
MTRRFVAAEDVSFFLDWVPYGKHASFYAGVKHGIYQKYGLNVKIQPGKGSGRRSRPRERITVTRTWGL